MNSASSDVCSAASMASSQCRRPVVTRADRLWAVGCEWKLAELPLLTGVFAIPPPRGAVVTCSRDVVGRP
jgi:hypothetical protein